MLPHELLLHVPPLGGCLPGVLLAQLARQCELQHLPARGYLHAAMLPNPPAVWLTTGLALAETHNGQRGTLLFGPDNWCVLPLAIAEGKTGSRIRALRECTAVLLPQTALRESARQSPMLAMRLALSMAQQQAQLAELVAILQHANAQARVAYIVLKIAELCGCCQGEPFAMPASQADLASLVGISREVLNRELGRLRATGVIAQVGSNWRIENPEPLRELIGTP